jgi:probable HAF family extracellular repeat protein
MRSGASDLNNSGTVAGQVSYIIGGVMHARAFTWDEATGTTLIPPLGPGNVGVTYVSDEGLVLGASEMRQPLPGETRVNPLASTPGTIPVHAWKWSAAGGLVDLGTLGGDHSVAWNADRAGNVYGWASDAAGAQHAVKWTADGGIVDLGGLGGNTLTGGLNKHGVVAGWSTVAGQAHAVIFAPRKK